MRNNANFYHHSIRKTHTKCGSEWRVAWREIILSVSYISATFRAHRR